MYPSEELLKSTVQPSRENTLLPEACGIFAVTGTIGFAAGCGEAAGGSEEFSVMPGLEDEEIWEAGLSTEEAGLSDSAPEESGAREEAGGESLVPSPRESAGAGEARPEEDCGTADEKAGGTPEEAGSSLTPRLKKARKSASRTGSILFFFMSSPSRSGLELQSRSTDVPAENAVIDYIVSYLEKIASI